MILFITDPGGEKSYPIVTYTWIMVYQDYEDDSKAMALKDVLKYCLSQEAQEMAIGKGYVPLPKKVTDKVLKVVEKIK